MREHPQSSPRISVLRPRRDLAQSDERLVRFAGFLAMQVLLRFLSGEAALLLICKTGSKRNGFLSSIPQNECNMVVCAECLVQSRPPEKMPKGSFAKSIAKAVLIYRRIKTGST